MLLGQELKFKNKLCNLRLGTFFSALPGGSTPGGSNTGQTGSEGQGSESGGGTTGKDDTGDGLE